MIKKLIPVVIVILAAALMAPGAIASLMPMSWGFPTLVQNNSLTSFDSLFSSGTDLETADIAFPTAGTGLLGTAFPSIAQLTQQGNLLSHISGMSGTEYSQFAYPWLSIGYSPVPSMGLL